MKKKFSLFLAIGILILPSLAFASDGSTLSFSPTSTMSGSEGSVSISFYAGSNSTAGMYLFNPSGISVTPSVISAANSASPESWATLGFSTGLATGTWTIQLNNGSGNSSQCDSGQSLSGCQSANGYPSYGAAQTILITASSSGSSTTSSYNINSSTILNWQNILFVKTEETDQLHNSSTNSTTTITQIYDPMDLYWVLLTGLIVVFGACYCVFRWMYD